MKSYKVVAGLGALGLLAAAGTSGCAAAHARFAHAHAAARVVALGKPPIPASKYGRARVMKVPRGDIGYPSEGVMLAPAPPGASAAVSAAGALASFKRQVLVRDVLGPAISSKPTVWLKLITEYLPTYPGLRPGVRYIGWVIKYGGVKPVSYGPKGRKLSAKLRCTFIGLFDPGKSAWTTFFLNCPG